MIYKLRTISLLFLVIALLSFRPNEQPSAYKLLFHEQTALLEQKSQALIHLVQQSRLTDDNELEQIRLQIADTRKQLKCVDFWLRYLDPIAYKKINGPLPVEWETEVFEKFEKPYKREGAGLTLASLYLDEDAKDKKELLALLTPITQALNTYQADSVTTFLNTHHTFFLCNRLFLLNLAAIYTTGFECPDTDLIIPELQHMLNGVQLIYKNFNQSFSEKSLTPAYLDLYEKAIAFVAAQDKNYSSFDHFSFIRDYVNPLFVMNQQFIRQYGVSSRSYIDYSLTKNEVPIFSKKLYHGQQSKGIFLRVYDTEALAEIEEMGRLLFYDPILSANNQRSCASCHQSAQGFSDGKKSAAHFNRQQNLARNTPSLLNAGFNHLLMLDGKHISLQEQAKAVICNPDEMGSNEQEVLKKVLSCKSYRNGFEKLLKYTPQEKTVSFDHIVSALTYYFGRFSLQESPFDLAMNKATELNPEAKQGFNIFMSKAQCATCHFVPQFNGVKPPYIGSEFEVLGVPADTLYTHLSPDQGRYQVNPADETRNAFRTGTLRNSSYTAPYMHNGVFNSLEQVIDFYDRGGGIGHGFKLPNQTLSSDSLHLSPHEKQLLISFIRSLDEEIPADKIPQSLPHSKIDTLNTRSVGGSY